MQRTFNFGWGGAKNVFSMGDIWCNQLVPADDSQKAWNEVEST